VAASTDGGYAPGTPPDHTASSDVPGGASQRFLLGQDLPAQWWKCYHADALDSLMEEAIRANPDLQAAQAALRQAKEMVYAQQGAYYPAVGVTGSAARERISTAAYGIAGPSAGIFNLYNASVGVSYTLDVFGGMQRQLESLAAQADYERFQFEAAFLSLTGNVVTAAVREASLRAQIAALDEVIARESEELTVLKRQLALGGVSQAEVLAQETIVTQSRAQSPALHLQLSQVRNQLALLAGRVPSHALATTFALTSMSLPQDLPVSLPSQLVNQRPDVRSAEALLHQACANIGVAVANELPQFSLNANYGGESLSPGRLFSPASLVWGLAGSITQPIFEGGKLVHQRRAADAAFDQAAAHYRSVVLAAFAEVANALRALDYDAQTLAAQVAAEHAASASLALSTERFRTGAISHLEMLNAEVAYAQSHISLAIAQAARFADTAALFQALGGGWWKRDDLTAVPDGVSDPHVPLDVNPAANQQRR
jgi:NodT family efflux transporter outer membrane factor (OMF) lipoprotein